MKRSEIQKSKPNYSFEISPQGRNDNLNVILNETQ